MVKKIIAGVVGVLVFGFAGLVHADFVGNKDSKIFHADTCPMVKAMKSANIVNFKTAAEALKAGYTPCKKCSLIDVAALGFIGNKSSMMYHKADCRMVAAIKADNVVKFASEDEAKKAGYKPCSVCFPKDKKSAVKK